jgi:uncharacterized protein YkwD
VIRALALAVAAAALLAFPAVAGAAGQSASEASLLKAINKTRAEYGLAALRYDAVLARAAAAHTRDMAVKDYFAHGDFRPRMLQFRVRGPFVGENLAWGAGSFGTPQGIVRAWLASPAHRANLLRPGFRRVGLGELRTTFRGASGASVVTADFAGS